MTGERRLRAVPDPAGPRIRHAVADSGCRICGVPSPDGSCRALARHLGWMRLRGCTAATIYSRRRAMVRLGLALPVPVLDADEGMLAAWRAGLDLTDGAVVHEVSAAREFYRWAIAEGIREDNPAAGVPVPKLGRRLPRPVGEAELMTAVEAAPPRIRPMLVLAGWCGLRACEISALSRESILDTAAEPVLIVASGATKGHAPERAIPLSAFVLAELAAAGLPSEGLVFRRMDGRRGPVPPWRVSQLCNNHLHDLGIPATLHQLRHRMLSGAYQATKDLRLVQSLAGHASPTTTAGYAQFAQAGGLTAVEALGTPASRRRQP